MKGGLINEITVCALTVVIEALAVIGGEHDQRFVQEAKTLEESQKISEHPIDVGQFGSITPYGQIIRTH
jgi:tRNA G26 N,N-dimethylase Trm1